MSHRYFEDKPSSKSEERTQPQMTVDNSFTMKKFQSMEIIYVTFSQITKLPYVECDPETFDDQVYMFTEEEAAKEFAKSYVEKNTPLLTVKVLRKQMPNFYMASTPKASIWSSSTKATRPAASSSSRSSRNQTWRK